MGLPSDGLGFDMDHLVAHRGEVGQGNDDEDGESAPPGTVSQPVSSYEVVIIGGDGAGTADIEAQMEADKSEYDTSEGMVYSGNISM